MGGITPVSNCAPQQAKPYMYMYMYMYMYGLRCACVLYGR